MSGNDVDDDPISLPSSTTSITSRERDLEAKIAELTEARQLLQGTYYATIEQVWSSRRIPEANVGEHHFQALRRDRSPSFLDVRSCQKGVDEYGTTRMQAISSEYDMVSETTTTTATSPGSSCNIEKAAIEAEIWPRDVLERTDISGVRHCALGPFQSPEGQPVRRRGDLCPGPARDTSRTLGNPTEGNSRAPSRALAGPRGGEDHVEPGPDDDDDDDQLDPEPPNPAKKRKRDSTMDPGCTLEDDLPPKSDDAKDPDDDNEPKDGTRSQANRTTGLKHMVSNKIRLAGHKYYLDERPCVVIVPVMDLATMKGWNGEEYQAIVLAGDYDNGGDDDRALRTSATIQTVCSHITMQEPKAVADAQQIECARLLLEQVILGMAHSLKNRSKSWDARLGKFAKTTLQDLRTAFEGGVAKDGGVAVPATPMESKSLLRVRLVTFGRADIFDNRHPAPDPLLLAVRSAVNWSRRQRQPLLSYDEHPEIDDELDVLAMEEHRDMQDRNLRPRTWEDVAIGLGYLKREPQHGGAPNAPSSIPSW